MNVQTQNGQIYSYDLTKLFSLLTSFEIVNVIIQQYAYRFMLYSMFYMWKVLPK